MSEKKTPKAKEKKQKSKSTDSAAKKNTAAKETKSDTKKAAPKKPQKTEIQNGKGSAPRNISPEFRSNYDKIKGMDRPKGRQEGKKFVKVYK